MLPENVPAEPSPEQPHERPYDPPQPDPQAAGNFANRRNWRGHLCSASRLEAVRNFSVAKSWPKSR